MKASQSPFVSLVIVGVVVLLCVSLTVIAPLVVLWRINDPTGTSSSTVPHLTAAESNRLAREAFGSFDIGNSPLDRPEAVLPPEFAGFLGRLELFMTWHFASTLLPVDEQRMLRRLGSTGRLQELSMLERRNLTKSALQPFSGDSFLDSLVIVQVDSPATDPETYVVYAIGFSDDGLESREWRFWFSWHETGARIFDWQRIDLGMSHSEWLSQTKIPVSPKVTKIEAELEHVRQLVKELDFPKAKAILESLESNAPSNLRDCDWLRMAVAYQSMNEHAAALKCSCQVTDTEKFPGAHRIQQRAHFQLKDFETSIEQGQAYAALVGKSPEVCLLLGMAFHAIGKPADGNEALDNLFRSSPWRSEQMAGLTARFGPLAMPVVDAWLKQDGSPLQSATELANQLLIRDDGDTILESLIAFVATESPESAEGHWLKGELAAWNDDYETALAEYRLAKAKTSDSDQLEKFKHAEYDAMQRLGEVLEVYDLETAKSEMIVSEYWAQRNGDSVLSDAEWTELLLQHGKHFPDDPLAVDKLLEYLIANGELERAEREIRTRFNHWPVAPEVTSEADVPIDSANEVEDQVADEMSEAEEPLYESHISLASSLPSRIAEVMALTGRSGTAYEETVQRAGKQVAVIDEFFAELADVLVDLKQWEALEAIVEQHQLQRPADPNLAMYRGDLAVHQSQFSKAIEWYEQAMRTAPDDGFTRVYSQRRLYRTICDGGLWLDYYRASAEKSVLFQELAEILEKESPEQLELLVAEHLAKASVDRDFAIWMAGRAEQQNNVMDFEKWLDQAVSLSDASKETDYEVKFLAEKLPKLHVRTGNYELARQEAGSDPNDRVLIEALIDAHQQNHASAAAKLRAADLGSMYELTKPENLRWEVFRSEYRELQRSNPFGIDSLKSHVQWVGYLREPFILELPQVAVTAREVLGDDFTVAQAPLDPNGIASCPTFVFESTSTPHARWFLQLQSRAPVPALERSEFIPEQVAADNARATIVVGRELRDVFDHIQSPLDDLNNDINKMLRLMEALVDDRVSVWYAADDWKLVLPSSAWKFQTTDRASSVFRRQGIFGPRFEEGPTISRDQQRRFRKDLRAVLSTVELAKLRVRMTHRVGLLAEPVWFTVESFTKRPNDIDFLVVLVNDLLFAPKVTSGLPCRVRLSELDAWQIEGQDIVELGSTE